MHVTLRVVGIFFNRKIEIKNAGKATVKTLLDAAAAQFPIAVENGFSYYALPKSYSPGSPAGLSLVTMSHYFSGKFDFEGDGSDSGPNDGPTLSGATRPRGIYTLTEQSIQAGVIGWQYYVVRDKVVISETKPARGFQNFDQQPIQDGDKVIWRLVAICTEPMPAPKKTH